MCVAREENFVRIVGGTGKIFIDGESFFIPLVRAFF